MQELFLPYFVRNDLLSYDADGFQALSSKFADRLENIAAELRKTEKSSVKVRLVGELAKLVSEDAAGFTYMSEACLLLNRQVRDCIRGHPRCLDDRW